MNISAFSKTYDGAAVLDFPGLELRPGKICGVIGANGSGKSTFAKVLAGILKADQKHRCTDVSSVGYMPQKNYAFRMSTRANILLGNRNREKARARMDALQLRHLETRRADKLSGGEAARMALARLMMKQFELLILDEPTAAMDLETTLLSENLIVQYVRETNCTLILITHNLQQARRIADEAMFFHKGHLLEYGLRDTVLYHPAKAETKQFLEFYGI